jgi:hypothetical protein
VSDRRPFSFLHVILFVVYVIFFELYVVFYYCYIKN